MKHTLCFVC
jgi:hypothetical protein